MREIWKSGSGGWLYGRAESGNFRIGHLSSPLISEVFIIGCSSSQVDVSLPSRVLQNMQGIRSLMYNIKRSVSLIARMMIKP